MKRVQVEPHLSVTGGASAEWIPIKPKTDVAFLFAMIHVLLHEHPRNRLDVPFLKNVTSSPYLIGPDGYFLRSADTRKPLMFDLKGGSAVPFDAKGVDPALEGTFKVDGIEVGPDNEVIVHHGVEARPAFAHLVEHVKSYSPEWASSICDVPAATIRRVTNEFLDHAHVGETIEVEGVLYRHPAVLEAAVVARPDDKWGETPCAFVTLKDGKTATADEIIAFCKANLASFKVPRTVVFGPLAKTSTGKIQKYVLRDKARAL